MLKAVLLDFDGLILDTETPEFQSWCEIYESHGQTLTLEAWCAAIGTRNGFDPYTHLEGLIGAPVDREALRAIRRPRNSELLATQRLLEGVEALVDEARDAGLRTAVVSSSDRDWVEPLLEAHGLLERFDAVVCAGGGLPAKPDPRLYFEVLRQLGVLAAEAIAFEDSPNGIAAARAAGIRCIAVPNELTRHLDLSAADGILPSLAAFPFSRTD
jgi:HAD superfamily hydrolase (TIGR01509 family)